MKCTGLQARVLLITKVARQLKSGCCESEKKEVYGQPAVEARARARDGSRSRWGALAEQGEAGSGLGRRPLPCQCGSGAIAPVWVSENFLVSGIGM